MTAGSLDLGGLLATVDIVDAPFQAKYVRLLAQFAKLGGEAASSSAGTAKLDESLLAVGGSADKASVGLGRVTTSATRAAAAEAKLAAAAERHSVATANVNRVMAESAGMTKRQQIAALQLVAAQDRLNAAQEGGVATTRALASAQAGLIAAQRRVETAQVAMATRMTARGKQMTHAITLPVAVLAGFAAKTAMDFEAATNVYVTAAGESEKNLGVIRKGIKDTAVETGTSIKNLTDAEYLIEKAGIRGASGLKVLGAAAKGAREENAQLSDVVQAMTSVMASYHLGADKSVQVMNALKTGAGQAKVSMEDYSRALSTVIPIASANKISIQEVFGAYATLTQHGTSANEATQELAATIRQLAAPNRVAQTAMQALGLTVNDVTQNIGKRGLTGTIDLLIGAITQHMGPAGLVLQNAFNQSKSAGRDVQVMLDKMPPSLQKLATSYMQGKTSLGDWRDTLKGLPPLQAALLQQFAVLANKAGGFNAMLRAGDPQAQTFTAALKKVSGGAIGLNTILQLAGENMAGFKDRTDEVGKSLNNSAKEVEGWESTAKLSSTRTAQFKESLHVLAINAGATLLPMLNKMVDGGTKVLHWVDGLSGTEKKILGWSLVVLAAFGPVTRMLGGMIGLASRVVTAFRGVTAAAAGMSAGSAAYFGLLGGVGGGVIGGTLGANLVAGHVKGGTALGGAATVSGGALGGAAAGAALGSVLPGPGTVVGGAIGFGVGSIVGAVKAYGHMGDAAKRAGKAAKAALEAQKASADALYQSLVAAGGAYNDMSRGEISSQLSNSGALAIADKAGVDPGKLISGVLGTDGPKGVAALSAQLENAASAGKITFTELAKVQRVLGTLGASAASNEKKFELQARAMQGGVLSAAQLGTSLTKLKAAFHGTGTTLDHQTASGIRNNQMLKEEVNSLNEGAVSALKHHRSVKEVASAYEHQIGTLRKNLTAMHFNGEEIDEIIAKYGRVPKSVATELKKRGVLPKDIQAIVDKYNKVPPTKSTNLRLIDYITGRLRGIQARIDSIHGKTVVITALTLHKDGGISTKGSAGETIYGQAEGGPVVGPGSKGVDSVRRLLAPGEWVINDRSVDKYGSAFMAAVNAGTYKPHAAAGAVSGLSSPSTMDNRPAPVASQPVRPIHLTIALDGHVLRELVVQPEIERAFVDLSTALHQGRVGG